jgi:hypothetical protein
MWQYLKLQKVHHHYTLPFCLDQLSFFFIYFSKGLRKDSKRIPTEFPNKFQKKFQREFSKDIPKEFGREFPKEFLNESPKELSKEFLKELPKEFLKEFPKGFLKNSKKNKSYLSQSGSLTSVVLSLF